MTEQEEEKERKEKQGGEKKSLRRKTAFLTSKDRQWLLTRLATLCVCGVTSHTEHVLMESREGDGEGMGGSALSDSRSHYAAHEAAQELQLQPHVDENDEEEERGRVRRERKQLHTKQLKKKKNPQNTLNAAATLRPSKSNVTFKNLQASLAGTGSVAVSKRQGRQAAL